MNQQIETRFNGYQIEDIAYAILDDLPKELGEYFDKYYQDNILAFCDLLMAEWERERIPANIYDSLSMRDLVEFVLWESLIKTSSKKFKPFNEKEALAHYASKRKNNRQYIHSKAKEEYEGKTTVNAKRYIEKTYAAVSNPYLIATTDDSISSLAREEYFEKYYNEVKDWYHNPNSYVFQYPFFEFFSPKRRVGYFMNELGWQVFNIICDNYYNNSFGFATKSPDANFGIHQVPGMENAMPLVNWQSSAISVSDLKYEASDTSVTVYEHFRMGKGAELKFIIEVIDNLDCSTPEKKVAEIERIKAEYLTQKRVGHLDATDFAIYTALLNHLNYDIVTGKSDLIIYFLDLAKYVYGKDVSISLKKCRDLFKRLQKLQEMKISSSLQDSNNVPIQSSVVNFFTFSYNILMDSVDSSTDSRATGLANVSDLTDVKLMEIDLSGNATISNIDMLTKSHFCKMVLKISPSDYMKNEWQQDINSMISSDLYQKVTSQKGRMLLHILQKERLKAYPDVNVKMNNLDLLTQIRITSGTESRFKREVVAEFEYFKQENILIEDFSVKRGVYFIRFTPLTEKEKVMYKIKISKTSSQ